VEAADPQRRPTLSLLSIDLDCPWCFTATMEALEADPQVIHVTAHSADGCIEVTHHDGLEGVLTTINSVGHTIEVASNGEAVMAPAQARVETACRRHGTPTISHI
jgi:hypothetical protein